MQTLVYSDHANARIQQRGISKRAIQVMLNYGLDVPGDGLVMTRRDIQEIIDENNAEIAEYKEWLITTEIESRILFLKAENERLRKLINLRLVVCADKVVTVYVMNKRMQRKNNKHIREVFN